jgi:hypothetical protein
MKVLALALVLTASGFGQQLTASNSEALTPVSEVAPNITSISTPASSEPTLATINATMKLEPVAKVLPEAPRHVADKKFWTATGFQLVAATIDVESTIDMTDRGCTEGWSSWIVGKRPSRATLYPSAVAGSVATATVAYFLKKRGKSYWWMPQVTAGSVHTFAASRNRFLLYCHR